jgi:hypothetical protein
MAARKRDELEPKKEEKKATEKPIEPAEDGSVEIEVAEPEDEEADEEEPHLTRAEKKRNRYREAQDRARLAEERAAQAEARAQERERQIAEWQQGMRAQQGQQMAQGEIQRLYQEQEDLYTAFEAKKHSATPEEMETFKRRAQDLELRKYATIARLSVGQPQQYTPQDYALAARRQMVLTEYADIAQHQQAWVWANKRWEMRHLAEGEPDTKALMDEVAEETRRKFGIKVNGYAARRPPPDEPTRARYSGISANSRGGSNGDDGGTTVRVTAAERKMAVALYPKLSEAQAIQKWANGPGKRVAQSKSR